MTAEPDRPFGYGPFGTWYEQYRAEILEPATVRALDELEAFLDRSLSDRERSRIRKVVARTKSKRRTWRKIRHADYRDRVHEVADIPEVVDDLVGLRITCTNLRDLEMVQLALDELPRTAGPDRPLAVDPDSERDYIDLPKESGYRGWHVNLSVWLDGRAITCELQVRTLLQDSWGELTHEDTYATDGRLPPLVEVLSARMADLLATLDDIAEDLRTELDRVDEAVVVDREDLDGDARPDVGQARSMLEADAVDLLAEQWRSAERPLDLAGLAWLVQREFGADISDDWFGHRSFKRFVRSSLPGAALQTGSRAVLLPPGAGEAAVTGTPPVGGAAEGGPGELRALRGIDRSFPSLEPSQWRALAVELADAWWRLGPAEGGTRTINRLTRSARDRSRASGQPLSRRHLDYVAKGVVPSGDDGDVEPMSAAEIADRFADQVVARLVEAGVLPPDLGSAAPQVAAVRAWLGAAVGGRG